MWPKGLTKLCPSLHQDTITYCMHLMKLSLSDATAAVSGASHVRRTSCAISKRTAQIELALASQQTAMEHAVSDTRNSQKHKRAKALENDFCTQKLVNLNINLNSGCVPH